MKTEDRNGNERSELPPSEDSFLLSQLRPCLRVDGQCGCVRSAQAHQSLTPKPRVCRNRFQGSGGAQSVLKHVFFIPPPFGAVRQNKPLLLFRRSRRRQLISQSSLVDRRCRVAVVGGGIAGASAAFAMKLAGFSHVTLFEAKQRVGGNANTHTFRTRDGKDVRVGLSVLAWPKRLFRHYEALLDLLHVKRELVKLPFVVQDEANNKTVWLDQRSKSPLHSDLAVDMTKWRKMINFILWGKRILLGSADSLYSFNVVNPFNFLPLRWLSRLFGVSDLFWNKVVVPLYSSTFLTSNLDFIPSVITPFMDEIVPLDACPELLTWSEGSAEVFEKMLAGVQVFSGEPVRLVSELPGAGGIIVETDNRKERFDRVVMACDARTAQSVLQSASWLLRFLLRQVIYVDDLTGADFLNGWIHRDASVLSSLSPPNSNMSNYIAVREDGQISNTFVLSSWIPSVLRARLDPTEPPFLVTYNAKKKIANPIQEVVFRFAHPMLCFTNLVCSFMLRFVHTPNRIAFCGSWTTPGNGHDLCLLSGFVAAHALGASYPFANDKDLCAEFERARGVLGQ